MWQDGDGSACYSLFVQTPLEGPLLCGRMGQDGDGSACYLRFVQTPLRAPCYSAGWQWIRLLFSFRPDTP